MIGCVAVAVALAAAQPTAAAPGGAAGPSVAERLVQMRALFDALECEKVIALAAGIEADPSASVDEKREARFRDGYCLVIVGNVDDAGAVFRELVHEDLDAPPPFAMEQRVKYLYDAAREAERKSRDDAVSVARAEARARVALVVDDPKDLTGGARAIFAVHLIDPDLLVKSMRIDFKKAGDAELYGLPVVRQADGTGRGEIPGTYTRSALVDARLLWFITASDERGDRVASAGTREHPRELFVKQGSAVALDLRANERLGQGTRYVFAFFATPTLSVLGAVGAFGVSLAGGAIGFPEGVVSILAAVLPPLGAAAGCYFGEAQITDFGLAQLGPPIAVAAVGAVFTAYGLYRGFVPGAPGLATVVGVNAADKLRADVGVAGVFDLVPIVFVSAGATAILVAQDASTE